MSEAEVLVSSKYGEEKNYFCEYEGRNCEVYYGIKKVPEEWIENLCNIYDENLHNEEAVQEQSCYTRETFISALNDPGYEKIILVVDGLASGLLMGTNSLEKAKVAYINTEFIRERFPREVEEGRFWYITCIFISSHLQGFGFIRILAVPSFIIAREKNYVLAGDFSNNRLFVPDLLVEIAKEADFPIEKQLLGSQSYFAFPILSG